MVSLYAVNGKSTTTFVYTSESCESPESPLKIDKNTQLYTTIDNLQKMTKSTIYTQ